MMTTMKPIGLPVINTSRIGKTKNCVETKFRVFPISTSVNITVYLYGKTVLYFFYNIAQKIQNYFNG